MAARHGLIIVARLAVEVGLPRNESHHLLEARRFAAEDPSGGLPKFGQCTIRVAERVVEGEAYMQHVADDQRGRPRQSTGA